jgi:hypothetical protein
MSHKILTRFVQGTYEGSCVICLQGTDTGLQFIGEAEWLVAALMHLGVRNQEEAVAVVGHCFSCDPGRLPNGVVTMPVRLCESCLKKSDRRMQVGLVASGALPTYRPQRSA